MHSVAWPPTEALADSLVGLSLTSSSGISETNCKKVRLRCLAPTDKQAAHFDHFNCTDSSLVEAERSALVVMGRQSRSEGGQVDQYWFLSGPGRLMILYSLQLQRLRRVHKKPL